jgi:hypothetical protein
MCVKDRKTKIHHMLEEQHHTLANPRLGREEIEETA